MGSAHLTIQNGFRGIATSMVLCVCYASFHALALVGSVESEFKVLINQRVSEVMSDNVTIREECERIMSLYRNLTGSTGETV